MFQNLLYAFNPANFEPHGSHFIDTPVMFWLLVTANLLTFVSYTLIPIVIVYFVRKRKDLVFHWVFLFFGAFIVLCGVHHLMHVITYWYPIYAVQAVIDTLMSIVSFGTFLSLIPVVPLALNIPSRAQLTLANRKLSEEVERRQHVEMDLKKNQDALEQQQKTLSQKNAELEAKSKELEDANGWMVGRELKMIELKKEIEDLHKKLSES